jgi:hypothetical protein
MKLLHDLALAQLEASSKTSGGIARQADDFNTRVPLIAYPFAALGLGACFAVLMYGVVDLVTHVAL